VRHARPVARRERVPGGLLDGVDHAKGTVRMPVDRPLTDEALRALVAARRAQIEG
jgi:uncharacterized protein YdhG (YjbR/CyaY superfamily)